LNSNVYSTFTDMGFGDSPVFERRVLLLPALLCLGAVSLVAHGSGTSG
jgi:hypothetical protein